MACAISWVARRTGGDLAALWVIRGAGSYGALLAGAVARAGYQVIEAPQVYAPARRGAGKSDALDSAAIAAGALPLDEAHLRIPRQDNGILLPCPSWSPPESK